MQISVNWETNPVFGKYFEYSTPQLGKAALETAVAFFRCLKIPLWQKRWPDCGVGAATKPAPALKVFLTHAAEGHRCSL